MIKRLSFLIAAFCATPVIAQEVGPARLTNFGAWLAKREPPPGVLKRGERVLTWLALEISPDGSLANCSIKESSGYTALDEFACDLVRQNGRFAAARDASGKMLRGVYEPYLTWETGKNATDADVSKASTAKAGADVGTWVTTNDVPRGLMAPDEVVESYMALQVSAKGRVTTCTVKIASERPELDRRACELMILRGNYKPARDFAGKSTEGVDWRSIRWQVPRD